MASKKVVKFKRANKTAKVLFAIMILYIFFFGVVTFSKKTVKTYEVQAGMLSSDNAYTGLALRDEEVVNSAYSGNVNYYVREGSKVKANDIVYTVDETGRVASLLAEMNREDNSLSKEDVELIRGILNNFKTDYRGSRFSDVYALKTNLDNIVLKAMNESLMANLDVLIAQTGSSNLFQSIPASQAGIVEYFVDGFETVNTDNFSDEMLDRSRYSIQNLYTQNIVVSGKPVYKLIKSEKWSIVFKLTKEEIDRYQLGSKTTATVRFKKNKIMASGDFSLIKRDDASYGVLTLDGYMVRFANDRYLEFELLASETEGLKLPISALTEEYFYTIPKAFVTTGGNSSKEGFLCEHYDGKGNKITEFITADIYYRDDQLCYVHPDGLEDGYKIIRTDSADTFTLGARASLQGVYCVNTGYTVFRRVDVLEKNREYCIVKKGISYGISLYDRIVLDSDGLEEGVMIY